MSVKKHDENILARVQSCIYDDIYERHYYKQQFGKLWTEQMKKQEDHDDHEINRLNIKNFRNKEQVML